MYVYVANGNSDAVSVVAVAALRVRETIAVQLLPGPPSGYGGGSPNALALSADGTTLYVANGLDNAVAVVMPGQAASAGAPGASQVQGCIPTEAYPGGLTLGASTLFVANLEGGGGAGEHPEHAGGRQRTGSQSAGPEARE